jgi:hypothetical protein
LFGDKKEGARKIRQKGKLEVPAVGSSDLKKGCRTMNAGIISLGEGMVIVLHSVRCRSIRKPKRLRSPGYLPG